MKFLDAADLESFGHAAMNDLRDIFRSNSQRIFIRAETATAEIVF
jgi:hypothetical protein